MSQFAGWYLKDLDLVGLSQQKEPFSAVMVNPSSADEKWNAMEISCQWFFFCEHSNIFGCSFFVAWLFRKLITMETLQKYYSFKQYMLYHLKNSLHFWSWTLPRNYYATVFFTNVEEAIKKWYVLEKYLSDLETLYVIEKQKLHFFWDLENILWIFHSSQWNHVKSIRTQIVVTTIFLVEQSVERNDFDTAHRAIDLVIEKYLPGKLHEIKIWESFKKMIQKLEEPDMQREPYQWWFQKVVTELNKKHLSNPLLPNEYYAEEDNEKGEKNTFEDLKEQILQNGWEKVIVQHKKNFLTACYVHTRVGEILRGNSPLSQEDYSKERKKFLLLQNKNLKQIKILYYLWVEELLQKKQFVQSIQHINVCLRDYVEPFLSEWKEINVWFEYKIEILKYARQCGFFTPELMDMCEEEIIFRISKLQDFWMSKKDISNDLYLKELACFFWETKTHS